MICRNTFSSSFSGEKMSLSLEALRLQPLERTTAVFSMVLGFIHGIRFYSCQNIVSIKTLQGMF